MVTLTNTERELLQHTDMNHIDYWKQVADIARGLTGTTVYVCVRPGMSKQFTIHLMGSWAIAYMSCPDTPRLSRPPWLTREYLQREWERRRGLDQHKAWYSEHLAWEGAHEHKRTDT